MRYATAAHGLLARFADCDQGPITISNVKQFLLDPHWKRRKRKEPAQQREPRLRQDDLVRIKWPQIKHELLIGLLDHVRNAQPAEPLRGRLKQTCNLDANKRQ